MSELFFHNQKIDRFFQLLGDNENALTSSLAWSLNRNLAFLKLFLERTAGKNANDLENVIIRLQEYESQGGLTDVEIESPGRFFLILEAKRGWQLPGRSQLKTYARRRRFRKSSARFRRLVVLTECSKEYVQSHLSIRSIDGVPVDSLSWKEVVSLAAKAIRISPTSDKKWLKDFITYLGNFTTMQNVNSNSVFVVALSSETQAGWRISWIDIVKKRRRYFHPVGNRWPKEPPNYIAFRYHGRLQSIHHINKSETIELHEMVNGRIPEIPSGSRRIRKGPHFLYRIGPAFGPSHTVKTGNKIRRNAHAWCDLDTLFTSKTISEALETTKSRRKK